MYISIYIWVFPYLCLTFSQCLFWCVLVRSKNGQRSVGIAPENKMRTARCVLVRPKMV